MTATKRCAHDLTTLSTMLLHCLFLAVPAPLPVNLLYLYTHVHTCIWAEFRVGRALQSETRLLLSTIHESVLDATYVAHQLKTPVKSRTGAERLSTLSIPRPAVSRLCTLGNAATPNTTIGGRW
jgi:hypothetical protein